MTDAAPPPFPDTPPMPSPAPSRTRQVLAAVGKWLGALLALVVAPQFAYGAVQFFLHPHARPGIGDLIPPWWLLMASAIPAVLLAGHRWRADAAGVLARPARSLGCVVAPFAAMLAVGLVGTAFGARQEPMMAELGSELAQRPAWALGLAIALMAPVLEEVAFRGLAWRWLRPVLGGNGTIGASSLVFVALHAGQYGGFGLLMVAALATVLGTIRERTGSLLLCIGGHVLVNTLSVAALLAS